MNRPGRPVGPSADDRGLPSDARPDEQLVKLTLAEVEKSGGRLSYAQANLIVLKRDPALAEAYRSMPGIRER